MLLIFTVLVIRIVFLSRLSGDFNNFNLKKDPNSNTDVGGVVFFTLYLSSEYFKKDIGLEISNKEVSVGQLNSPIASIPASKADAGKAKAKEQLKSKDTAEAKVTASPTPKAESKNTTTTMIIEDTEPVLIGSPKRLLIPSLGINVNVQHVGLNASGAMDVPSNTTDVAWFKLGVRPGQKGNAVVAGHLDSANGKAVFWDLNKLQVASDIYIIDENDNRWQFKVVGSELIDEENGSLESVFGRSDKARLNLITCGGVWNKEKKNYSQRLVVFTEAM